MRLGQLARRLSVPLPEIASFLEVRGIVTDGVNTRLQDSDVEQVLIQFAPHLLHAQPPADNSDEPKDPASSGEAEASALPVPERATVPQIVAEPVLKSEVSSEELPAENVIKAPKVELKGLKVLGKIDLPEPRKKEVPPAETAAETPEAAATQQKPEPKPVQRPEQRPERRPKTNRFEQGQRRRRDAEDKNPVALQREKELKQAEEQKKQQALREKEKRTEYYMNRVKSLPPPKQIRMVDEPLTSMEDHQDSDTKKGWWARFKKWLTS